MISDKFFSLGVATLLFTCLNAGSQEQSRFSILDRANDEPLRLNTSPELEPLPIDAQGFDVLPEVEFSTGHSSNVVASDLNEVSDSFVGFAPGISVRSNWSRHELLSDVKIRHVEYSELTSEGRTEIDFGLRGRLDMNGNSSVSVELTAADEAEDRHALSSVPDALEPTDVARIGAGIGFSNTFNRIKFGGDLHFKSYDFEDVELGSGLIQDQDFRDRDELIASLKLAYALSPSTAVYTQLTQTVSDYSPPNIFNAFNRDYDGTVVSAGLDFDIGDTLRGDFGLGYQRYVYDEDSFEDIDDVNFTGNVDWLIGDRTLLTASANRSIFDPGLITTNAAIETAAGLNIEQALTRKVSVNGGARLARYDFENIDREDDRINLNVGANWKLNKNLWIEGGYELTDQTSSFQEFTDNRFLIKMRVFP